LNKLFKNFLAYIGCYASDWRYWDLFTNGLTQSFIQESPWNTNIWQPGQNVYAWTSLMTVTKCVNYCYSNGYLLAGLAQGF